MELQDTITRENLETLMTLFYHQALKDEQIGHYFKVELGEDIENAEWIKHIDILVDFWASVFINDPEYGSDPYGPHFTLVGLNAEDFRRWVELFSKIAKEVYVEEIANEFKEKGIEYSKDFMKRLKMNTKNSDLTSAYW
ncbi:MAG TPA: group III truncated hemoglobin [Campylobacterales bacterium]|nr:group III truncated hemoglobin [Campylobacterales bacterium]